MKAKVIKNGIKPQSSMVPMIRPSLSKIVWQLNASQHLMLVCLFVCFNIKPHEYDFPLNTECVEKSVYA